MGGAERVSGAGGAAAAAGGATDAVRSHTRLTSLPSSRRAARTGGCVQHTKLTRTLPRAQRVPLAPARPPDAPCWLIRRLPGPAAGPKRGLPLAGTCRVFLSACALCEWITAAGALLPPEVLGRAGALLKSPHAALEGWWLGHPRAASFGILAYSVRPGSHPLRLELAAGYFQPSSRRRDPFVPLEGWGRAGRLRS